MLHKVRKLTKDRSEQALHALGEVLRVIQAAAFGEDSLVAQQIEVAGGFVAAAFAVVAALQLLHQWVIAVQFEDARLIHHFLAHAAHHFGHRTGHAMFGIDENTWRIGQAVGQAYFFDAFAELFLAPFEEFFALFVDFLQGFFRVFVAQVFVRFRQVDNGFAIDFGEMFRDPVVDRIGVENDFVAFLLVAFNQRALQRCRGKISHQDVDLFLAFRHPADVIGVAGADDWGIVGAFLLDRPSCFEASQRGDFITVFEIIDQAFADDRREFFVNFLPGFLVGFVVGFAELGQVIQDAFGQNFADFLAPYLAAAAFPG